MDEPLVSIIMRSYNEGWALRETLPALRAQDYRNWELIIIDSGSTTCNTGAGAFSIFLPLVRK